MTTNRPRGRHRHDGDPDRTGVAERERDDPPHRCATQRDRSGPPAPPSGGPASSTTTPLCSGIRDPDHHQIRRREGLVTLRIPLGPPPDPLQQPTRRAAHLHRPRAPRRCWMACWTGRPLSVLCNSRRVRVTERELRRIPPGNLRTAPEAFAALWAVAEGRVVAGALRGSAGLGAWCVNVRNSARIRTTSSTASGSPHSPMVRDARPRNSGRWTYRSGSVVREGHTMVIVTPAQVNPASSSPPPRIGPRRGTSAGLGVAASVVTAESDAVGARRHCRLIAHGRASGTRHLRPLMRHAQDHLGSAQTAQLRPVEALTRRCSV